MDERPSFDDFEYTFFREGNFFGVKDGKTYPVKKEEWDKAHPKHADVGCMECSFVPDIETLLIFMVPREKRERAGRYPEFIGQFTMSDWAGHASFYLFKCLGCDKTRADYPHGYCDGEYLYFKCDECHYQLVLNSRRYKDIYEREKMASPPTFWQTVQNFWRLRKGSERFRRDVDVIENDYGVRVVRNGTTDSSTESRD